MRPPIALFRRLAIDTTAWHLFILGTTIPTREGSRGKRTEKEGALNLKEGRRKPGIVGILGMGKPGIKRCTIAIKAFFTIERTFNAPRTICPRVKPKLVIRTVGYGTLVHFLLVHIFGPQGTFLYLIVGLTTLATRFTERQALRAHPLLRVRCCKKPQ